MLRKLWDGSWKPPSSSNPTLSFHRKRLSNDSSDTDSNENSSQTYSSKNIPGINRRESLVSPFRFSASSECLSPEYTEESINPFETQPLKKSRSFSGRAHSRSPLSWRKKVKSVRFEIDDRDEPPALQCSSFVEDTDSSSTEKVEILSALESGSNYSAGSFEKSLSSDRVHYKSMKEYRRYENEAQKVFSNILKDESIERSDVTFQQQSSPYDSLSCTFALLSSENSEAPLDGIPTLEKKLRDLSTVANEIISIGGLSIGPTQDTETDTSASIDMESQIYQIKSFVITLKAEVNQLQEEKRMMAKKLSDMAGSSGNGDSQNLDLSCLLDVVVAENNRLKSEAEILAAKNCNILQEYQELQKSSNLQLEEKAQFEVDQNQNLAKKVEDSEKLILMQNTTITALKTQLENISFENNEKFVQLEEEIAEKDQELLHLREKSSAYIHEIMELEKDITMELDNISFREATTAEAIKDRTLSLELQLHDTQARCQSLESAGAKLNNKIHKLNAFNSHASIVLHALHNYIKKLQQQHHQRLKEVEDTREIYGQASLVFIKDIISALYPVLSEEAQQYFKSSKFSTSSVIARQAFKPIVDSIHQLVEVNAYLRNLDERRASLTETNCDAMLQQVTRIVNFMTEKPL
ncbi:hypothetical protein JA9_001015 [Meyerozyma sp. JA9]|nr:hypothetical protein JA9_001015 [Meyerozyma sp. JA9]